MARSRKDHALGLRSLVSLAVVVACLVVMLVGGALFRASLTDVNGAGGDRLGSFAFQPVYATSEQVRTYSDAELRAAWRERYGDGSLDGIPMAQVSARLGMQPKDPGLLADCVVVGTFTGKRSYGYRSFVDGISVERVLVGLSETSKLAIDGGAYTIPRQSLGEGDTIFVYDEFAIRQVDEGTEVSASSTYSPYTSILVPMRVGQRYLLFLNHVPKGDSRASSEPRFRVVPSLYGRIAACGIDDGGVSTDDGDASPEGGLVIRNAHLDEGDGAGRVEGDRQDLGSLSFSDAMRYDLFVASSEAERAYRDACATVLGSYGLR